MLNYVLLTTAMVFSHKLTQTSWCCAVSASLEVKLVLGNKVLHNPADAGGASASGHLHCHCVSGNSSFTPIYPKYTAFLLGNSLFLWSFIAAWQTLSLSQTICKPTR